MCKIVTGRVLVIEAIHSLFPWLRHLFADAAYAGRKLHDALTNFGQWTVEIVKRSEHAAGFEKWTPCDAGSARRDELAG